MSELLSRFRCGKREGSCGRRRIRKPSARQCECRSILKLERKRQMPRRVSPQPQGPTLPPERSIPALEELIAQATEVKAQPYGSAEKKQWGSEAKALLEAALGEDHSIVSSFSRDF